MSLTSHNHSLSADDDTRVATARYRAFVEQDAAGIVELDCDGRFRLVNRKFCEITGYSEAELLGRSFQSITHPDDLAGNLVKLHGLVDGGVPYGIEKRYIRKDGGTVWVYVSATLIEPHPGAGRSLFAVVVDLSERRRVEARLGQLADRYQTLINSVDAGFCVVEVIFDDADRAIDYVFVEVNERFETVAGLRDAVGRRMRELAPDNEPFWFETYGEVAQTGVPIWFEHEARAVQRWFSVHAFRVGDPPSRLVAILFEDISVRKRSESRRAFLAHLSEVLVPMREENEIIRTAAKLVAERVGANRCAFVECLESENRIVFSADYASGELAPLPRELGLFAFGGIAWWRAANSGDFAVEDVTSHPLTCDHAEAYQSLAVRSYLVQPYRIEGPWTVGLVVSDAVPRAWTAEEIKLIDDVVVRVWPMVERARSERALVAAHEALELRVAERTATLQETVSELESFSYSISHDLRAPLRAMQSYAAILEDEGRAQLGPEAREYLRRIRVAADRMDRLIRDVLVYSRIARGQIPVERVELGPFIASIIESYPDIRDAKAEIELVSPLGAVRANPAALTQCVSNLLGNAIKFTAPGVQPKIRVWSQLNDGSIRVFIRDNGIGIPAEAREKIFGMFYQVDQRREGTGVGLAVVRKAAERMSGAVGVGSTPGQGSTFWLQLPAA